MPPPLSLPFRLGLLAPFFSLLVALALLVSLVVALLGDERDAERKRKHAGKDYVKKRKAPGAGTSEP